MRLASFMLQFLVIIKLTAGFKYTNCYIDGVPEIDWMLGYVTIPKTIDDTYRGPITTYETRNITGIFKIEDNPYLTAEITANKFTIYTSSNFENFEEQTERNSISIKLTFNCSDDTIDALTFHVNVRDVNNHRPSLNKEAYEYSFGMDIPKGFELTAFGPINGTDKDFTNRMVYFEIDKNEDFSLKNMNDIYGKIHFASLKALRTIKSPYRKQFTMFLSDKGSPNFITTAPITITVSSIALSTLNFSSNVYYGNYMKDNSVKMDEPLTIKYGCSNTTVIRQHNYSSYFNVSYNTSKDELIINNIQPLTEAMILQQILVITIEAETPGVTYIGTTTVIIRTDGEIGCSISVENSYDSTYVAIGIGTAGIVILVILNLVFFRVWYRKKMKSLGFVIE
ncbi:hypothetical protein RN001_009012 [Aquatica leii]|uniref:Cadherin domain-containing protein n=1 Tax=Aquatica leii TaxID=1421715 RepID=A0AAN7P6Z5_9COLE|nr:hypothetical protein RN001_009012 [Aquatica leii]